MEEGRVEERRDGYIGRSACQMVGDEGGRSTRRDWQICLATQAEAEEPGP